jgi:MFS family permease
LIFLVAYGAGTAGYWVCGRMMDRVGRRPTAITYGILAALSAAGLFQARSAIAIGILLVVAVFFGLGMAPVTGAISTELFPTYIRNQSAAWCRNIFEIAGFILGPLLVGVLGDHYSGPLGSIGDTVTILVLLFLPATWLIWRHLPETKGRELEEIQSDLGLTDAGPAVTVDARRSARPWIVFAGTILTLVVICVVGVRALGDVTRRPEGAAERFLQAVDDGDRSTVERYGSPTVALAMFGNRPVDFKRVDVFRAQQVGSLSYVPIKVETEDGRKLSQTLLVARQGTNDPPDLKVVSVSPVVLKTGTSGPDPAPKAAWPIAFASVLGLTAIAETVLRALRNP